MKFLYSLGLLTLVSLTLVAAGCNNPETVSTTENAVDGHAEIVEVTLDNYDELVNGDTPVLLDFWATWCGPCVAMTPDLESIAAEYKGRIIVGKVNVDEQPDLARQFNINPIPALFYMKDGEKVGDQLGQQSRESLARKVEQVLSL